MLRWLGPRVYQGVFLVVMDIALLYVATGLVHKIRLGFWIKQINQPFILISAGVVLGLYLFNAYSFDRRETAHQIALRTFAGVVVSGLIISSFIYVTKSTTVATIFWRGNLPITLTLFALIASLVRYAGARYQRRLAREMRWMVIGDNARLEQIRDEHKQNYGHIEVGLLFPAMGGRLPDRLSISKGTGEVGISLSGATTPVGPVDGIVLATDQVPPEGLLTDLMHARLAGIPVLESAEFYERFFLRVPVMHLRDRWFAFSEGFGLLHHDSQMRIKRVLDVVVAVIGLVLALPVMLLIAALVRLTSAGEVLYSQTRCGQHGEPFVLRKFRTMVQNAERDGARWASPDDPRVTPLGRLLRRTRLDELPQLWNVLKGAMSFVGPRPERPDFVANLEKEIPYYDLRHLVKPGLTGWAQVMYPYGSSVEDAKSKLEYDLYYIKNYSLALDLYIVLRTIRVVLSRSGY
jgi:sugar transferase (PEP-CTERM system associated)